MIGNGTFRPKWGRGCVFIKGYGVPRPENDKGKTSMSEDVSGRVSKIVVEHLGVDESKVTNNASFIDDLGADSLDTVELVMAFEEEFGCEIPDDAA